MFGIDFFPTPIEVIFKVLSSVNVFDKIVLEPSAGKGNIVEYVQGLGAKDVLACEIDDNLRSLVSQKCRVIKDDFLQVRKESGIDIYNHSK